VAAAPVEVVRSAFEALRDRGVDGMLEHVHEEFEMATPAGLASEPDTYRGHAGARRWFDEFYEAMDRVELEVDRLEPLGERVIGALRIVTRGRSSGLEGSQAAATLVTVEDGKVARLEFFPSWDEAVESAGA
jgi:ketosteroid isomerase-like protein